MASNVKLIVEIITEAKDAVSGAQKAASGFDKMQAGLGKLAAPAAAAGAAAIAIGSDWANAASDMEQSMGGLEAVFGDSADAVKDWAKTSARDTGLSSTAYAEMAAKMGAQFKNMGMSSDEAADATKQMIKTGADLAATYGGDTADAVDALGAALRGEADPAERYGLALSQSALNAQMAADGTDDLTGAAKNAAKAQTILKLTTKQAGGAMGQFEREFSGAAGQAQYAKASWADARAELGTALLPVMTAVGSAAAKLAGFVRDNQGAFIALIAVIGTLSAGILAANAALKIYQGAQAAIKIATTVWTGAQWLLNAALSANPIGLVIAAVVALGAAFVVLWKKSETFRNIVLGVWKAVKTAADVTWKFILKVVTAAWNGIKSVVETVSKWITTTISAAKDTLGKLWGLISANAIAAWNAIKEPVSTVIKWIKEQWDKFITAIKAIWDKLSGAAETAWEAVEKPVTTVIDWIEDAWDDFISWVTDLWDGLASIAATAWSAVYKPVETVIGWIEDAWDALVGFVSGVWDRISSAVETAIAPIKTAIDAIKDAWDATVGAISSTIETVKGWIGGVLDKIGDLAGKVGTVTNMDIGFKSAAPSSVSRVGGVRGLSSGALGAPLRTGGSGGGGGGQIIINGALDPVAVARQVERLLKGEARRRGPVRMGVGALV